MSQELIVTSPAEDHGAAHAYAVFMADVKRKVHSHTYLGARWELALARYLGPVVLAECRIHLDRVAEHVSDDFWYDFRAGDLFIDAKSTLSRNRPWRRNNLLITPGHLRAHVAYVLGDAVPPSRGVSFWPIRDRDGEEDIQFEAPGWTMGEPSLFSPATTMGIEGLLMMERARLRPLSELRALVRAAQNSASTELNDVAAQ